VTCFVTKKIINFVINEIELANPRCSAVSTSELLLVMAFLHLSAVTTECLKAACLVICFSPFKPRQLQTSLHLSEMSTRHSTPITLNFTSHSAVTGLSALSMTVSTSFVAAWLVANGLCLNPNKSEEIVIGSSARQRSEPQIKDVTVAGVSVPVTRTVKNVDVTTDDTLSFDDHINNARPLTSRSHISRCVSVGDAKTVATAMMSSRLDCCISILYGTSQAAR